MDRFRVIRIEIDETRKALTMKTLAATANVLNCDFVYAFVPREPLHKMVDQQANKIATRQLESISHNMFLEDQALSSRQNKKQLKELKVKLLENISKNLWSDSD